MSNQKLLIVEDNADNLKLVSWILEDEGFDFDAAMSGEECLQALENQQYALVLLDISLPGIDGKDVALKIRQHPELSSLPIVACTAHAIKQEEAAIWDSGVNEIITKPIDEAELLSCLRKYLQ